MGPFVCQLLPPICPYWGLLGPQYGRIGGRPCAHGVLSDAHWLCRPCASFCSWACSPAGCSAPSSWTAPQPPRWQEDLLRWRGREAQGPVLALSAATRTRSGRAGLWAPGVGRAGERTCAPSCSPTWLRPCAAWQTRSLTPRHRGLGWTPWQIPKAEERAWSRTHRQAQTGRRHPSLPLGSQGCQRSCSKPCIPCVWKVGSHHAPPCTTMHHRLPAPWRSPGFLTPWGSDGLVRWLAPGLSLGLSPGLSPGLLG